VNQLQSWYYRQPSALRIILLINVSIYLLARILTLVWRDGLMFIIEHFALHPTFPGILLEPWQLVTYNFMHTTGGLGGLLHIAFNMYLLFIVGREYEEMHGASQMWTLYLLTGIGGGLISLLLMPLGFFGGANVYIVGASASVLGVIMGIAIMYPYKKIGLFFFGVIPLLYFAIGLLIFDLLVNLGSSTVAITAHWGGALTGYLYAKAERGGIDLTSWTSVFSRGSKSKKRGRSRTSDEESLGLLGRLEVWLGGNPNDEADVRPMSTSRTTRTGNGSDTSSTTSSKEEEIDRILDKISEQGYDALSDEEKRILYEASQG